MSVQASLLQFGTYMFPTSYMLASRSMPQDIDEAKILGVDGVRITPGFASSSELVISGQIGGGEWSPTTTSQLLTIQDFQNEANALFAQLASGYQQLTIGELPARYCYAQKTAFEVKHDPGFPRYTGNIQVTFKAQDPRWISTAVHTAVLPSGTTSLGNLGSANSFPQFSIAGPCVNPSIQIANPYGYIKVQLFVTMGVSDTLLVLTDPAQRPYAVQLNSSIAMNLLSTSSFTNTGGSAALFPYLPGGTWACTVLLGGSGTCTITWNDAWWI